MGGVAILIIEQFVQSTLKEFLFSPMDVLYSKRHTMCNKNNLPTESSVLYMWSYTLCQLLANLQLYKNQIIKHLFRIIKFRDLAVNIHNLPYSGTYLNTDYRYSISVNFIMVCLILIKHLFLGTY